MNPSPHPQREKKRWPRRLPLWIGVVLLLATGIVWQFGTGWSLPGAEDRVDGYELVAAWTGGDIPAGKLEQPMGIAVGPSGDVYVTDGQNRVIQLDATGRYVREWRGRGSESEPFGNPMGLAVAPDGSVYVSDFELDRVEKFTADGRWLSTFGNHGSQAGQFDGPSGLAVDDSGFIFVTDFYNHRVQKFDPDGGFVRIIGKPGRMGRGALHYPTGVAIASPGEVLVADAYNYRLQWFGGDGRPLRRAGYHLLWLWPRPTGSTAGFNVPTDAAVGMDGTIHVADSANHRVVMLNHSGKVITEQRIPAPGSRMYSPSKIAAAPDGGTVYATDTSGNQILVYRVLRPQADRSLNASDSGRLRALRVAHDSYVASRWTGKAPLRYLIKNRASLIVAHPWRDRLRPVRGRHGGRPSSKWNALTTPCIKKLNGTQSKTDYAVPSGFRLQFG